MIPKVIHYCWFGGNPLPADVKACIKSWKKHCPDYEIRRWDESNYDISKHPFIQKAAESKRWAFVSDFARLDIVLNHGGIYLDTDVELIRSLDPLLEHKAYFGFQMKDYLINTGLGFGAEAGHPAVQAMLDQYKDLAYSDENRDQIACPILNTDALFPEGIHCIPAVPLEVVSPTDCAMEYSAWVYPPSFFDTYPSGVTANLICGDTFSIHHYSATWTSGKQRWKRSLARVIGEGNIVALKELLRRK